MDIKEYNQYNNKFKKKFIYRLGGSTGFFSEYNNMVLAIHYCLVNRIQFVLESEGANFSSGKGWNELFIPFCNEVSGKWLNKFNYRKKPVYQNHIEWFLFNIYKRIHPCYIYMYSLFNNIRQADTKITYHISGLNISGTLLENCTQIHKLIWRYNPQTQIQIESIISHIELPASYLGLHIRRGDKYTESSLYDIDNYMRVACINSNIKDVFVLTDDYKVIDALERTYPNHRFYTLCGKTEIGYDYNNLMKKKTEERLSAIINLIASMDILENAELFVGTYSANPGMNMGFRLPPEKIKCLDYTQWQLW